MRVALFLSSVLLPTALLAAGCTSSVPRVAGTAAPIVAPSSASPTLSSPSSGPSRTPASPSSPAHTSPTTRRPSTPVLGPDGFGALKLGMTSKQATATGLITPWRGTAAAGCSLYSNLKAAPAEHGNVMFAGSLGVEIIEAYGDVRTPEGIHIGSSKAAMLKAYPDWVNAELPDNPHADGRGYPTVPGNSKAVYRIFTRNSKVVEITLQYGNENCYE